jgi:sigma-B regulation protein RsbU (phosphoserine phosphatase)
MESEIRLAGSVQRALLPCPDSPAQAHPGYNLNAALEPARECAGDFYDYFALDPETLVIAVGDVSGKGMPAALVMAMALTLLRSHGTSCRDPGRVLTLVNRALRRDCADGSFVTLFLGFYSIGTGRLLYANAGHHAALLMRSDGSLLAFGRLRDAAIGFSEDRTFRKGEARLAPGESLLLYTDGVTEAQGPDGELFGQARLETLLSELQGTEPEMRPRAIVERLTQYQGGILYDDITVLFLQRPAHNKSSGRHHDRETCPTEAKSAAERTED